MGGTQSWLNCDSNYRSPGGATATGEQSDTGGGDPIIAVMMFLGTLFGLLFLTAMAHCAFIAWRGYRSRHSRRHQQRKIQAPQQDVSNPLATAGAVGGLVEPIYSTNKMAKVGGNSEADDADADGDSSSCSSSSSLTSSDSSLDSTTARIAAQVASRRRSRFLDLAEARLSAAPPVASSHTPSPTSSWRPAGGDGNGGGFLRPPPQRVAFDNPAYDHRYDP